MGRRPERGEYPAYQSDEAPSDWSPKQVKQEIVSPRFSPDSSRGITWPRDAVLAEDKLKGTSSRHVDQTTIPDYDAGQARIMCTTMKVHDRG